MNIGFININTKSMDASIQFYTTVLGFSLRNRMSPRPGRNMAFLLDQNGQILQLVEDASEPAAAGQGIAIGFNVDDIEATATLLRQHKVRITNGPLHLPTGVRIMHSRDPNGVTLHFVQLV